MAVHCAINHPVTVRWIMPPVYQHNIFNNFNDNKQVCSMKMGSFESRVCNKSNLNNNNNVLVETIPLQIMSNEHDIFMKDVSTVNCCDIMQPTRHQLENSTNNQDIFLKRSPLQDTWPTCEENNATSRNEINQEDGYLLPVAKVQNKRTHSSVSDDTTSFSREFPVKRVKKPSFIVKGKEMQAFFRMLEDPFIDDFLSSDACKRISDKYLLAMVFAYFKRAMFTIREYNRINFFTALYLANDMEEDDEDFKYEIFPWALGKKWKSKYMVFLQRRDDLWEKMGYRAVVSKKCCEEIMAIESSHWCWQRERPDHHSGAHRSYTREENEDYYPRGPDVTPRMCGQCDSLVQYDSGNASGSTSWYISSCDSSPEQEHPSKCIRLLPSRFDMEDLRDTLQGADSIWAHGEE